MKIYTDGGPKKVCFICEYPNGDRKTHTAEIEYSTSFEAEYRAVIAALEWAQSLRNWTGTTIIINDNNTVVQQLMGMAQVSNARIKLLYDKAKALESTLTFVRYEWISGRENPASQYLRTGR